MAGEISLLSLVLTLRPVVPGPREAPAPDDSARAARGQSYLGRAAHAVLLDAVRHSDAALAEELHTGAGLRPFTASSLIGYSPRRGLSPERTYTLRFTALTAPVARALLRAADLAPSLAGASTGREHDPGDGTLRVGALVRLDEALFRVEAVDAANSRAPAHDSAPAAGNGEAKPHSHHPWAASLDYEALAAPWLLGRARPDRRLSLHFASPTTFKSAGRHVPVPLPSLVFGSLLEKWNAFAPVALPDEARRFADECLALSAYHLSTRMVPVKEGGLRAGAVGEARYTATQPDRYWLSVMHLLADFAMFAGVGAGTGMGLGQVRKIKGEGLRQAEG